MRFSLITLTSLVAYKLVSLILRRDTLAFLTDLMATMAYVVSVNWTFSMPSVNDEFFVTNSFMFN